MTLENLKDYWQSVCLKHIDVKQFKIGNYYDSANSGNDKYPLCFWEMPYSIDMNLNKPLDTVQVAFNVFLSTKQDDVVDAHQAISLAKEIGEAILLYVSNDNEITSSFTLDAVNGISVREYTDDYVAGMRWDLTMTVKRDICELHDLFNEAIA